MKDHVRRGQRARAAGQWTEAHAAYKAAFDAADPESTTERERAEIAGELGLCELALGKYRDAAEHLTWSLEQREALPAALQKRFEEGLRKATPHVAKLRVSVDPPDAEVFVDGKAVGRIARVYTLFVEPGLHMVRARAPGGEDAFQSVRAVAKAEHELSLHVPRASVSSAKEGAPVSANETPRALSSPAAAQTRPTSPWASWPGTARIGGIVVTTATAAAGAVFLLRAHVVHSNLRERDITLRAQGWTSHTCREASAPAACAGIRDQVNERDLFATLGKVSLATSAVFGVATAASFFTEVAFFGGAPKAAGVRLVPVTTNDRAGVLLEGAW
ncbi:PEGA domain-containing protein [Sorangium sp. So ce693]|uniref:PEGA domain-containing protein n=1 Tax=Sorangium sp. So ce693 TaxID=3133318 RepID=UPI003F612705